jgi:hypothetical protein
MWQDLVERVLAIAAAVSLGLILACRLASPTSEGTATQRQVTEATQTTAQAAPGSVIQIGREPPSTTQPRPP